MIDTGWMVDPFALHDARWFSAGTATALVRDGETESQDPPPSTSCTCAMVPVVAAGSPDDLLRSDFTTRQDNGDGRSFRQRATDVVCAYHGMA